MTARKTRKKEKNEKTKKRKTDPRTDPGLLEILGFGIFSVFVSPHAVLTSTHSVIYGNMLHNYNVLIPVENVWTQADQWCTATGLDF